MDYVHPIIDENGMSVSAIYYSEKRLKYEGWFKGR